MFFLENGVSHFGKKNSLNDVLEIHKGQRFKSTSFCNNVPYQQWKQNEIAWDRTFWFLIIPTLENKE